MKRGHAAAFAREQLERRIKTWRSPGGKPPARGWIREVREALGMSARQLGLRLKISQPAATALERAEVKGTIRLSMLQKAAAAMRCQVLYLIVPKQEHNSFADIMDSQAFSVAILESVMSLAKSGLNPNRPLLKEFIKLRAKSVPPHLLWDSHELDRQYEELKKMLDEKSRKDAMAQAQAEALSAVTAASADRVGEIYESEKLIDHVAGLTGKKYTLDF